MSKKSDQKPNSPNWPSNALAIHGIERQIQLGELGEIKLPELFPIASPRYLVTYMNSQTGGRIRSSTVVSVTNQSAFRNFVRVAFYWGLGNQVAGSCNYLIPSGYTIDFGSRQIPGEITSLNCVSSPELHFHEGRVVVSSSYPQIAVSSRVIYTEGEKDSQMLSITDSKIVTYGKGNNQAPGAEV
ncbi:MAG: hypothetical protein R8P61_04435 [Bacteroidia bacterium]|nr:hypothetical protein [Bacteroidia bacterium]